MAAFRFYYASINDVPDSGSSSLRPTSAYPCASWALKQPVGRNGRFQELGALIRDPYYRDSQKGVLKFRKLPNVLGSLFPEQNPKHPNRDAAPRNLEP